MFNRVNLKRITASIFIILCTIFFNTICCFASEPPKQDDYSYCEAPPLLFASGDAKKSNCYEDAKLGDYINAWFVSHLYDDSFGQM